MKKKNSINFISLKLFLFYLYICYYINLIIFNTYIKHIKTEF